MLEHVRRILDSPDFTPGEKWVVKWQFRLLGSFQTALADAIKLADDDNLARLASGFPDQVQGFLGWNRGDLARRLRDKGLQD